MTNPEPAPGREPSRVTAMWTTAGRILRTARVTARE
jgi:hypothetical protein